MVFVRPFFLSAFGDVVLIRNINKIQPKIDDSMIGKVAIAVLALAALVQGKKWPKLVGSRLFDVIEINLGILANVNSLDQKFSVNIVIGKSSFNSAMIRSLLFIRQIFLVNILKLN